MPEREGLALVSQVAGELSTATVDLYRKKRWYAGAALVRQFIECEYLVYLFAQDPAHSRKWLQSTRQQRLEFFKPASMRKMSNGKFRSEEYAIHCERGGHPSPMGSSLLAEHAATMLGKNRYLWCDLGQHLERYWDSFILAVDALDLGHVGLIRKARAEFPRWREKWRKLDLLSTWVTIKDDSTKKKATMP
jgi:hypothetical protein